MNERYLRLTNNCKREGHEDGADQGNALLKAAVIITMHNTAMARKSVR